MHDALFSQPSALSSEGLIAKAREVGLTEQSFSACMSVASDPAVAQDLADANALGIKSTPAFLFGFDDGQGRARIFKVLDGARPLADFTKILDGLLASAPKR